MSFLSRHRWVNQRIASTFNLDISEVEIFMRAEENFAILNAFLAAKSSKRLFVYYQSPDVQTEV